MSYNPLCLHMTRSSECQDVVIHALWEVAATGTTKHSFHLLASLPEAS